ncbi:MAG: methyltransferase domain-containing protein [Pelagibacteraceae bacterium]|nr:methyltransferase domain-containing protein [Pelagibacteraceae bacterium]PHX88995.1 MAG: SAM-dependent methyltransferase [Pelagibacteraceae bacterium]
MGSDLKIDEKIQRYIYDKGLNLHPIQEEIINYNKSLGDLKRMQISISQCQFLYLIVKISNIKNILEIGTFTGLSTLSMALALPDDGKIIALDRNEETNIVAINFFKKANLESKIKTIINPALETLSQIKDQKFDLVFIDADKLNYKNYYEYSISLINTNGLIIIDNVLWHGEVVDENVNDKLTINIREFNNYVANDKRVEKVIIPLGDGMTVCRKL